MGRRPGQRSRREISSAQVDRLVDAAILRFALATDAEFDERDSRRVDVRDGDPRRGTLFIEAEVTVADGLDLDHALAHRAAELEALGSTAPLDVRRSQALGDLARTQTALTLHDTTSEPRAEESASLPTARELVLTLHFDATLDGDALHVGSLGRLEKGHRSVLLHHVRSWCADSHTRVSIRPVIDLRETLTAPGYRVPDRLRDHVAARDETCMFPWCSTPASRCDLDHVIAYGGGGPTSTSNLMPLCRSHHRLKTHTGWRVVMPRPGEAHWTSPHGHEFRRDQTGTTRINPPALPRD